MVVYNNPPKVRARTRLVKPIFKPLFFIVWELALVQDTTDQCDGQPDNVAVRPLDPRDKTRRKALDRIGAGTVDRLTRIDVPRDVFVCHFREPHAGGGDGGPDAGRTHQGDAGVDLVGAAVEESQHAPSIRRIDRLAVSLAVSPGGRVRAQGV